MATSPQNMQQPWNQSGWGQRRRFNQGQFDPNQAPQQFQQLPPQGGAQAMLGGGQPNRFTTSQMPTTQQGPQTLAPGTPLTRSTLDPYLGKGGNVATNPYTGQGIDQADKLTPQQYIKRNLNEQSQGLLNGPAVQEAQKFQFNVPDSGVQGLLPQIGSASQNLLGSGQQILQGGQQYTQGGAQALLGNIGQTGNAAAQSGQDRTQALSQLQNLQQQALAPNIDPGTRQQLQAMADQDRANINARFADGGDVSNLFNRQNASDNASLAAKGVLDSQTAANVSGRRQADLGSLQANLLSQADQSANQRLIDERNRITQAAGTFGGVQGNQATGAGGLLSNLLGTQGQSASQLGGLGTAQQGIGTQLSGLGIQGLNTAGQLGLADQGQQADQQQAALSTRLMGNQLGLQNIQSYLNQILGRKATNQQMDYFTQLMQQQQNPQSGGALSWMDPLGIM